MSANFPMPKAKPTPPEAEEHERLLLPRPTSRQMEQMVAELCGDTRFQMFMEQIRDQREAAIQDLCNDAVVENHAKMAAAVGEVRCYTGILSLTDAHIGKRGIVAS